VRGREGEREKGDDDEDDGAGDEAGNEEKFHSLTRLLFPFLLMMSSLLW